MYIISHFRIENKKARRNLKQNDKSQVINFVNGTLKKKLREDCTTFFELIVHKS